MRPEGDVRIEANEGNGRREQREHEGRLRVVERERDHEEEVQQCIQRVYSSVDARLQPRRAGSAVELCQGGCKTPAF